MLRAESSNFLLRKRAELSAFDILCNVLKVSVLPMISGYTNPRRLRPDETLLPELFLIDNKKLLAHLCLEYCSLLCTKLILPHLDEIVFKIE